MEQIPPTEHAKLTDEISSRIEAALNEQKIDKASATTILPLESAESRDSANNDNYKILTIQERMDKLLRKAEKGNEKTHSKSISGRKGGADNSSEKLKRKINSESNASVEDTKVQAAGVSHNQERDNSEDCNPVLAKKGKVSDPIDLSAVVAKNDTALKCVTQCEKKETIAEDKSKISNTINNPVKENTEKQPTESKITLPKISRENLIKDTKRRIQRVYELNKKLFKQVEENDEKSPLEDLEYFESGLNSITKCPNKNDLKEGKHPCTCCQESTCKTSNGNNKELGTSSTEATSKVKQTTDEVNTTDKLPPSNTTNSEFWKSLLEEGKRRRENAALFDQLMSQASRPAPTFNSPEEISAFLESLLRSNNRTRSNNKPASDSNVPVTSEKEAHRKFVESEFKRLKAVHDSSNGTKPVDENNITENISERETQSNTTITSSGEKEFSIKQDITAIKSEDKENKTMTITTGVITREGITVTRKNVRQVPIKIYSEDENGLVCIEDAKFEGLHFQSTSSEDVKIENMTVVEDCSSNTAEHSALIAEDAAKSIPEPVDEAKSKPENRNEDVEYGKITVVQDSSVNADGNSDKQHSTNDSSNSNSQSTEKTPNGLHFDSSSDDEKKDVVTEEITSKQINENQVVENGKISVVDDSSVNAEGNSDEQPSTKSIPESNTKSEEENNDVVINEMTVTDDTSVNTAEISEKESYLKYIAKISSEAKEKGLYFDSSSDDETAKIETMTVEEDSSVVTEGHSETHSLSKDDPKTIPDELYFDSSSSEDADKSEEQVEQDPIPEERTSSNSQEISDSREQTSSNSQEISDSREQTSSNSQEISDSREEVLMEHGDEEEMESTCDSEGRLVIDIQNSEDAHHPQQEEPCVMGENPEQYVEASSSQTAPSEIHTAQDSQNDEQHIPISFEYDPRLNTFSTAQLNLIRDLLNDVDLFSRAAMAVLKAEAVSVIPNIRFRIPTPPLVEPELPENVEAMHAQHANIEKQAATSSTEQMSSTEEMSSTAPPSISEEPDEATPSMSTAGQPSSPRTRPFHLLEDAGIPLPDSTVKSAEDEDSLVRELLSSESSYTYPPETADVIMQLMFKYGEMKLCYEPDDIPQYNEAVPEGPYSEEIPGQEDEPMDTEILPNRRRGIVYPAEIPIPPEPVPVPDPNDDDRESQDDQNPAPEGESPPDAEPTPAPQPTPEPQEQQPAQEPDEQSAPEQEEQPTQESEEQSSPEQEEQPASEAEELSTSEATMNPASNTEDSVIDDSSVPLRTDHPPTSLFGNNVVLIPRTREMNQSHICDQEASPVLTTATDPEIPEQPTHPPMPEPGWPYPNSGNDDRNTPPCAQRPNESTTNQNMRLDCRDTWPQLVATDESMSLTDSNQSAPCTSTQPQQTGVVREMNQRHISTHRNQEAAPVLATVADPENPEQPIPPPEPEDDNRNAPPRAQGQIDSTSNQRNQLCDSSPVSINTNHQAVRSEPRNLPPQLVVTDESMSISQHQIQPACYQDAEQMITNVAYPNSPDNKPIPRSPERQPQPMPPRPNADIREPRRAQSEQRDSIESINSDGQPIKPSQDDEQEKSSPLAQPSSSTSSDPLAGLTPRNTPSQSGNVLISVLCSNRRRTRSLSQPSSPKFRPIYHPGTNNEYGSVLFTEETPRNTLQQAIDQPRTNLITDSPKIDQEQHIEVEMPFESKTDETTQNTLEVPPASCPSPEVIVESIPSESGDQEELSIPKYSDSKQKKNRDQSSKDTEVRSVIGVISCNQTSGDGETSGERSTNQGEQQETPQESTVSQGSSKSVASSSSNAPTSYQNTGGSGSDDEDENSRKRSRPKSVEPPTGSPELECEEKLTESEDSGSMSVSGVSRGVLRGRSKSDDSSPRTVGDAGSVSCFSNENRLSSRSEQFLNENTSESSSPEYLTPTHASPRTTSQGCAHAGQDEGVQSDPQPRPSTSKRKEAPTPEIPEDGPNKVLVTEDGTSRRISESNEAEAVVVQAPQNLEIGGRPARITRRRRPVPSESDSEPSRRESIFSESGISGLEDTPEDGESSDLTDEYAYTERLHTFQAAHVQEGNQFEDVGEASVPDEGEPSSTTNEPPIGPSASLNRDDQLFFDSCSSHSTVVPKDSSSSAKSSNNTLSSNSNEDLEVPEPVPRQPPSLRDLGLPEDADIQMETFYYRRRSTPDPMVEVYEIVAAPQTEKRKRSSPSDEAESKKIKTEEATEQQSEPLEVDPDGDVPMIEISPEVSDSDREVESIMAAQRSNESRRNSDQGTSDTHSRQITILLPSDNIGLTRVIIHPPQLKALSFVPYVPPKKPGDPSSKTDPSKSSKGKAPSDAKVGTSSSSRRSTGLPTQDSSSSSKRTGLRQPKQENKETAESTSQKRASFGPSVQGNTGTTKKELKTQPTSSSETRPTTRSNASKSSQSQTASTSKAASTGKRNTSEPKNQASKCKEPTTRKTQRDDQEDPDSSTSKRSTRTAKSPKKNSTSRR